MTYNPFQPLIGLSLEEAEKFIEKWWPGVEYVWEIRDGQRLLPDFTGEITVVDDSESVSAFSPKPQSQGPLRLRTIQGVVIQALV